MPFFSYAIKERLGKENQWVKLDQLIDWQPIKEALSKIYKNEFKHVAGVKPYSSLSMFKALLLQAWHGLSDPKLEEALRVRIDFMLFTGLGLEESTPDETTLCRFRNRLVQVGLDQVLFEEVNRQLEKRGLKIKEAEGAVIDASVIESAARPRRCIQGISVDREEPEEESAEIAYQESADPDARWLKKGKKYYYGYKLFLSTDDRDGYGTQVDMTPANRSEVKHFKAFINQVPRHPGMISYGDKGYASKENRSHLNELGLQDGLMEKAYKGRPLTEAQKKKNQAISQKRYIVEQANGTLKRIFQFTRATYMGLEKVKAEAFRKVMCMNLLKALNQMELMIWPPGKWSAQLVLI